LCPAWLFDRIKRSASHGMSYFSLVRSMTNDGNRDSTSGSAASLSSNHDSTRDSTSASNSNSSGPASYRRNDDVNDMQSSVGSSVSGRSPEEYSIRSSNDPFAIYYDDCIDHNDYSNSNECESNSLSKFDAMLTILAACRIFIYNGQVQHILRYYHMLYYIVL
jgi:hypothetical protein